MLLRENISQVWGFNRGDLNISASAVPNNKDTFKTKRNGKLQHIKLVQTIKQYMGGELSLTGTADGLGCVCRQKA